MQLRIGTWHKVLYALKVAKPRYTPYMVTVTKWFKDNTPLAWPYERVNAWMYQKYFVQSCVNDVAENLAFGPSKQLIFYPQIWAGWLNEISTGQAGLPEITWKSTRYGNMANT